MVTASATKPAAKVRTGHTMIECISLSRPISNQRLFDQNANAVPNDGLEKFIDLMGFIHTTPGGVCTLVYSAFGS